MDFGYHFSNLHGNSPLFYQTRCKGHVALGQSRNHGHKSSGHQRKDNPFAKSFEARRQYSFFPNPLPPKTVLK